MTINERVSNQRLVKPEIRDSKYWNGLEFKCDLYHLDMQDFYTYANMLTGADYRELQQYRAAEPVYQVWDWHWYDAEKDVYVEAVARGDECRVLYAAPQVTSVTEIAARLVDAYLMNEGRDSEFIACYTISKHDRISEKGKQIWEDWRALSAALKSSQAAPAVQAEQLFGNTEQVEPGNSPVIPDGSEDSKRLDWLDEQNKRLNKYYGTSYGWKFDANFQRNAMMLNDSNYPVMTVRQAIDEAMRTAAQIQEAQEVKK